VDAWGPSPIIEADWLLVYRDLGHELQLRPDWHAFRLIWMTKPREAPQFTM